MKYIHGNKDLRTTGQAPQFQRNRWSRQQLKWLAPSDNTPETLASDLVQLIRAHFFILASRVDGKAHLMRFERDKLSVDIPTHERGAKFAPLVINRLLRKFHIEQEDFNKAYNEHYKLNPETASAS